MRSHTKWSSACGSLAFLLIFILSSCIKDDRDETSHSKPIYRFTKEEKVFVDWAKGQKGLFAVESCDSGFEGSYTSEGFIMHYKSSIISGTFVCSFVVYDIQARKKVFNNKISLNTSIPGHRIPVRNILLAKAQELSLINTALQLDYSKLSRVSQSFGREFLADLDKNIRNQEIANGIFFHVAILQMLARKAEQLSDVCSCSTYAKYLFNESVFACTEDMVYSAKEIVDFYNHENLSSTQLEDDGVGSIISFAVNNPSAFLSQRQIDLMRCEALGINPDDITEPTTGALGCPRGTQGTDPGCCGNYSGRCWYCHNWCLWHDLACWCCDKWWCGWACECEIPCACAS
ncbi:MAG TPA: hypothetical protein VFV37_01210 [Luteibaculaceae bacterium]|nr:hypothetical protein [Luteibaculaceae bacterium]